MSLAIGLIHLGFNPDTDFICQDDGDGAYIKEWLSDLPQPSNAEIAQAVADAEDAYTNTEYQRDRADAYPSIADQLDQIYHEGIDAWKETIAAVKAEYPKP